MPRNGSGQFSPNNSSWSPGTNGTLATATDWNALLADLSAALTQSVSRDGQSPMIGNLPMDGNKIVGLSPGTGTGQALAFEQLFNQGVMQDLASAATTNIGQQNTSFLRITGTTTITSFGSEFRGPRFLTFANSVTLTNSSTLVLPGGANITTEAGDSLIVIPGATSGTPDRWIVVSYRANNASGNPPNSITTESIANNAVTNDKIANGSVFGVKLTSKIEPISASVASNALTVTLNPTALDFRSPTIGSGAVNTRTVSTAINAVVPSGATLGTTNATLSKVTLIAIDNAGTVELAVCNGSLSLDESSLISTTVLNDAADSATVIYSTTARTNVPFRVVGFIESTQATAGTWATVPSKIQGYGGQALQPDIKAALNAPGSAPVYACRAWVNFNGTTTPPNIRASGNVSSVTRNGTGDYTVNFTTAMPDANYSAVALSGQQGVSFGLCTSGTGTPYLTTSYKVTTINPANGTSLDNGFINVSIFR